MKKRLFISLLLLFIICSTKYINAVELMDYWNMRMYSYYVKIEDIYELNQMYQGYTQYLGKNKQIVADTKKFLMERAGRYKSNILYDLSGRNVSGGCVIDDDGYTKFEILNYFPELSNDFPYGISSVGSGNYYIFDGDEEGLKEFVEQERKNQKQMREAYQFVKENLSEQDYLSVDVNDEGVVFVYLCNEDKKELLESKGILWELCEISKQDCYQEMQDLWERRDELKIRTIEETRSGLLKISGLYSEEEFLDNIDSSKVKDGAYIYGYYYCETEQVAWQEDDCLNQVTERTDFEDVTVFLRMKRQWAGYYSWSDECFEIMEQFLVDMKELYPEYTYENLMTLGYICNHTDYYITNSELKKFVETVHYCENTNNPVDESEFGDPKHLALQVALEKYQELYPEKSYEELYDTYLRQIEENTALSQRQRRAKYCWEIFQIDQDIQQLRTTQMEQEAEKNTNTAILGSVVLFAGVVAMQVIKKRKEKEYQSTIER